MKRISCVINRGDVLYDEAISHCYLVVIGNLKASYISGMDETLNVHQE